MANVVKAKRGRPRKIEVSGPGINTPSLNLRQETKQSLSIVALVALAVLVALSLLNITGSLGLTAVRALRVVFGWGAFLLPIFFILIATSLYRDLKDEIAKNQRESTVHAYVGIGFLAIVAMTFLQLIASHMPENQFEVAKLGEGGGFVGALVSLGILKTIGPWAGFVLLLIGVVASILVAFNIPITDLFKSFRSSEEQQDGEIEEISPRVKEMVKINDPSKSGFRVESVGNANPVAAALSKSPEVKIPKFLQKSEGDRTTQANKPAEAVAAKPKPARAWKFPSLDIFEQSSATVDSGNIEANVAVIQKTLADFDIPVEMGEVNVGPTVTQYTLRPAEGIRLSAIVALQNDLKLALAASSIRIEAPIPGKALVGIEIPNKTTAAVRLREILSMNEFQNHGSPLAFMLGRDVAGKGIVGDLASMPHVLIAGSTGSGKSVAINVFLTSILVRNTPDDVRMILIDPKRVEMSLYNEIPHLITPVITDHQKAVNALRWAVAEMDRRYHLLQEARKRNIGEYNEISPEQLPYIVVVVDELADLMTVAKNDVETAIVRLAQMARAVGIHLVLATQRPSVDVITGLIKANVTSRIAFAVASQIDSRTILDQSGAEKLLGKGDMLYVTSDMAQPRRLQGAYITEKETKKLTDFLREGGAPEYNESVTEKVRNNSSEGSSHGGEDYGDDEPLLEEAKNIILESRKASASYLQRRMRIGYARAARILDLLEEQGIVGPADGARPREVYGEATNNFDMGSGGDITEQNETNDYT